MIHVWGLTDIGLVRKENQDAYTVRRSEGTGHLVCVVCDGMGGPAGGKLASTLATGTFMGSCLSNLRSGMSQEEMQRVAEFAVTAANGAVYDRSLADTELRGMGTTLVSAIIDDDVAVISNIGDSRAYLVRPSSGMSITRVTKDHSVVEKLVDMGNITPEQARSHPDRNLITRALGTNVRVESDTYFLPLQRGDYLLLCTDGLIDTVTDLEMEREINSGESTNSCLQRLLEIAKSRGAADNVTAVLLHVQ